MARIAIVGLALGVAALAGVAAVSILTSARAADQIGRVDSSVAGWGEVSLKLGVELEALSDYLRADNELGRSPLRSALGSARPALRDIERSNPESTADVTAFVNVYDPYTAALGDVLSAGAAGNDDGVELAAERASLAASSLRKQIHVNQARGSQELQRLVNDLVEWNRRVRLLGRFVVFADLVLLVLCAYTLVNHQRRLERQAVESKRRAMHDTLTGLGNRASLNDRLQQNSDGDDPEPVTLMLLDLDRFKEVNDTLGHHVGDLLLREVATRIRHNTRADDLIVRLGGDEFAVVLSGVADERAAVNRAEQLLSNLNRPANLEGITVDVSGSLGIALSTHGRDPNTLLQHADIAMYEAKRSRRGHVLFTPELRIPMADRLSVLAEFRQGIAEGQVVVFHQPKIDLATGTCCGSEALVRWNHPERGLLGPGAFIPQVEESDLIHGLTDLVIKTALEHQRSWSATGTSLPVAVNVATSCLVEPTFPARVAAALAATRAHGSDLILEITEGSLIEGHEEAEEAIGALHELGVSLSIDDFGTGYSALARLQALKIDELKIDRRFIDRLTKSEANRAIVQAMVDLGRALSLTVVAEGVEDEPTRGALVHMGCDQMQGFLVARPMPAHEFHAWLSSTQVEVAAPRRPEAGRPRRRKICH